MLNMANNEEEKQYYITDLQHDDETITITYADGSTTTEPFSEHNLGVLRRRLIEQTQKHLNPYLDFLSKHSFAVELKKYLVFILGLVNLYFLYNMDIHTIMKIILAAIIILGELGYYLYNTIYKAVVGEEVKEGLATEYYLNNLDKFSYYDAKEGLDKYFIPIEDIGHYKLTTEVLQKTGATIEELKKRGYANSDITLSYRRIPTPKETSSSKKLSLSKTDRNQPKM